MASIQVITSKVPKGSCFTIKNVPGKGLGVFATRDIKSGELILAEKPLLQIHTAHYLAEDVEAEFEKLSEEKKESYMSLASAHGQDPSKYPSSTHSDVTDKRERRRIREQHETRTNDEKTVFSVCLTNAMQVEAGAGIFELASRFNHACVPSACFSWDEGRKVETIYAVQPIKDGEEITLCYCDPFFDISMRRWELQHYGFQCQCKACIDVDNEKSFAHGSRERRWKMRSLEAEVRMARSDGERLQVRIDLVGTMKAEGMCTPYMGFLYLEIARLCARANDYATAVKAARKALQTYTTCVGSENEKSVDAAKSVRAFEKQLAPGAAKR